MNRMPVQAYSYYEIYQVLQSLRQDYDLVRLVDAEECRIIDVLEDGSLRYGEECFHLWGASQRCDNCSSYHACMTHAVREKDEYYNQKHFHITSVPVGIRRADGGVDFCIMELARVRAVSGQEMNTKPEKIVDDYDYLFTHDVLTRLYNQEGLYRTIRQKLMAQDGKRYVLIKGDILHFHMVNTLFGRGTGNEVLIGTADILRQACAHGEIYGRLRDDQFVVFAEKSAVQEDALYAAAEKVHSLIDSPSYSLCMHFGIYEVADRNMPLIQMMDRADIALASVYSKHVHSIAYYSEGMLEKQLEEQKIISEFQKNLKSGQFQIYLQPQVNLHGHIIGAEALVRWIRDDGTQVPLSRFLPVLARTELIAQLDAHVWDMAVSLLSKWSTTPLSPLTVSINVDPMDFYCLDVSAILRALCEKANVPVSKLHIEITETALTSETGLQEGLVKKLQEDGFTVEIDDFGKGSSSLSMLKDVTANVLKIDMGFLDRHTIGQRGGIILEHIVAMGNALNMGIIVEGVETEEQKKQLEKIGANVYQGFLFSRPLPVREFETLYQRTQQVI